MLILPTYRSACPCRKAHECSPWLRHTGFETVTHMIDGTFAHQDSEGGFYLNTDGPQNG
jgi:hypothetical protein